MLHVGDVEGSRCAYVPIELVLEYHLTESVLPFEEHLSHKMIYFLALILHRTHA